MLWHVPCLFHKFSLACSGLSSFHSCCVLPAICLLTHSVALICSPFSFQQFFLTLTRVVLNQFNRTILNTEFIEYIYCGCLLFHPPFDVFLILFSMSLNSFTQTFTGAPNIAFIISNICNFVNLSVFIPIHTYIYHKLPFL